MNRINAFIDEHRHAITGLAAIAMFVHGMNALYGADSGDVLAFGFGLAAAAYLGWWIWLINLGHAS